MQLSLFFFFLPSRGTKLDLTQNAIENFTFLIHFEAVTVMKIHQRCHFSSSCYLSPPPPPFFFIFTTINQIGPKMYDVNV